MKHTSHPSPPQFSISEGDFAPTFEILHETLDVYMDVLFMSLGTWLVPIIEGTCIDNQKMSYNSLAQEALEASNLSLA